MSHHAQQQSLNHPDNMIKVNLPCALKQKAQLSFLTPNQQNAQNNAKMKPKPPLHYKGKMNHIGGPMGVGQSSGEMKPEMKPLVQTATTADKKFVFQVFNCTDCNATFTTEKDYNFHSRTHKPQPYKCSECPRAYTRREKLTEHIRCFHQGQKFSCEYCHKSLSRKDHVLRHVRSVHPEVLANRFVTVSWFYTLKNLAFLSSANHADYVSFNAMFCTHRWLKTWMLNLDYWIITHPPLPRLHRPQLQVLPPRRQPLLFMAKWIFFCVLCVIFVWKCLARLTTCRVTWSPVTMETFGPTIVMRAPNSSRERII